MSKELDEERSKAASAQKEQQQMKTLLEQKSIELKKNLLLNEELTNKLERLRQERDNIMTERNKLAMDQQALVADKEVRISVIHVLCNVWTYTMYMKTFIGEKFRCFCGPMKTAKALSWNSCILK